MYPWLNVTNIPRALDRDVETRAVERFFVNWTLYPSNHGDSSGELDQPALEPLGLMKSD